MKLVLGSRGSKLALAQTQWVADRLCAARPELECEIRVIRTKGDRVTDKPLDQIGDKGLFVGEIEAELLRGTVDIGVHSMKDMPTALPAGLCFARTWPREDARDVLVLRAGLHGSSLDDLPAGACVATGSKRRAALLKSLRPDLRVAGIRGNIDTRLRKLDDPAEGLDALVLAAAGLHRLGLTERLSAYLAPAGVVPACAQGALALELRRDDTDLLALLNSLCSPGDDAAVAAERAFLAAAGGSCHLPVGAYAVPCPGGLRLTGLLGRADGPALALDALEGPADDPGRLGRSLALHLNALLAEQEADHD